jgi:hypothetical protein
MQLLSSQEVCWATPREQSALASKTHTSSTAKSWYDAWFLQRNLLWEFCLLLFCVWIQPPYQMCFSTVRLCSWSGSGASISLKSISFHLQCMWHRWRWLPIWACANSWSTKKCISLPRTLKTVPHHHPQIIHTYHLQQ